MSYNQFKAHIDSELKLIKDSNSYKDEHVIGSAQSSEITLISGEKLLNFCGNNYLGLSTDPRIVKSAKEAMDLFGFGMSSVRFICGTHELHKSLEAQISSFFDTDDTLLYAACFDANSGLFESLFDENDAIISDSLNHASIIDGIRLCKAKRYKYANVNMQELESCLIEAQNQRFRLIVTDAVFSMDGHIAPLDRIYALAQKYDALLMIDECHSAGVVGITGRGATEFYDLQSKVDIITGTLGKAFGGALGGFTTGKKEIIDLLRQKSRPYLFSNSLPPSIAAAGLEAFKILDESNQLHTQLELNVAFFLAHMKSLGFDMKPTNSAIFAVMLNDEQLAYNFAEALLKEGIYVVSFSYPVVPLGKARIRVQISSAHTRDQLEACIDAFETVGLKLGVIK